LIVGKPIEGYGARVRYAGDVYRHIAFAVLFACGCQRGSSSIAFDTPLHFKNGGGGVAGGVTFTVRLLPKLIVSGPQPEIEQAQIECTSGAEHGVIQVDTLHKSAEWGGLAFELGYADVYHDDIELKIHRK
jgi:hypothetical protein